ncbi:hypothetical protein HDV05_003488 [Chytridiales sp. JEL 0842]|nr:hypothetical protein HDV05_003488 [Chytridiales sp. JEL 0842]
MMNGEKSLNQLFKEAQGLYKTIDGSTSSSSDPSLQADISTAVSKLETCVSMIRNLAIFSSNETLEDINTLDLRFFLVDYYLGELHLRIVDKDRMAHLKDSVRCLSSFITLCNSHGILQAADKEYFESEAENVPKNAERRRMEKIARFKREKAAKEKLAELIERNVEVMRRQQEVEQDYIDEELQREIILTMVDLAIQRSFDSIKMSKEEILLLESMQRARSSEKGDAKLDEITERLDRLPTSGALLSKDGKPLRPFVITKDRNEVRDRVFRQGHNLPTMTIEEYLEREMERGNFIQGGGEPPAPNKDDLDDEASDLATMKARAFDDFKDWNPKGWGNRIGRG